MLDTLYATAWVRQGDWIIYLYPWHQNPQPHGIDPISEGYAADSVESWFPIDDHHWYFTRWDLGRLFQETTGIRGDLYLRKTTELRRWLQEALLSGEVVAYRAQDLMPTEPTEPAAPTDLTVPMGPTAPAAPPILTPPTEPLTANPRRPIFPVRESSTLSPRKLSPDDSHHVFGNSGPSEGLPDELAESCPSVNWRSEDVSTASPEVHAWLQKNMSTRYRGTRDGWNYTLGSLDGGGFIAGTARVVILSKNTPLWRFYGGDAGPYGGWWSHEAYRGDPREFSALPPGCTGEHLVQGVAQENIEVLEGLGAPRCTNKPGGPAQLYLPYEMWGVPASRKITLV